MKELEIIGREVDKLRAAGKSAVLATVVGIQGSSYRLPGARMRGLAAIGLFAAARRR